MIDRSIEADRFLSVEVLTLIDSRAAISALLVINESLVEQEFDADHKIPRLHAS